jgi:hypothetical protein
MVRGWTKKDKTQEIVKITYDAGINVTVEIQELCSSPCSKLFEETNTPDR